MKKEWTCIVCPLGCNLIATIEEGAVVAVEGNTCPRGEAYARTEHTAPMRTLTTTVRCVGGKMLPVRTDRPIPKGKMMEAMEQINKTHPRLPISVGDVIMEEIFGAKLIATGNLEE